jgi:hypothetical protein
MTIGGLVSTLACRRSRQAETIRPSGRSRRAAGSLPWVLSALICAGVASFAHAQEEGGVEPAADAARREAMAESIVSREEAAAGRVFDTRYRAAARAALVTRPLAAQESITRGSGLLVLGDGATSQVFTPVAPCRIIDTTVAGGPIAGGTQRNFLVAGAVNFPNQGGQPGGCGIPFGPATSVMINFVAVGPQGPGNLRAFAFGSPVPNASIINYANVPLLNIANGIAVTICSPAQTTCDFDLTVQADASGTHLVADVVGFFEPAVPAPPLWAVVTSAGTLSRGFHAVSATRPTFGQYNVVFDRDVTACVYVATIGSPGTGIPSAAFVGVASLPANANGVFVQVLDQNLTVANQSFHLVVHC